MDDEYEKLSVHDLRNEDKREDGERFEDTVPIVFSGKDGKLDLAGHEMEVKDISVYE